MTMGNWALDGIELTDAEVRVAPVSLQVEQSFRQARVPVHADEEFRELLGRDLPQLRISISFLGRGDPKFDVMRAVQDVLDENEVWTLRAPDDKPVFVHKNWKRAVLSADSWSFDAQKATGRITLSIQATVDGVWIADGGTYCEPVIGSFAFISGEYHRDDGVNTGGMPRLELPDQSAGYPQFLKPDFTYGLPDPVSLRVDGDGKTWKTYNMTGFLTPAPAVSGDVGVYEGCSSPTLDFLDVLTSVPSFLPEPPLPILEACQTLLERGFGIEEQVTYAQGDLLVVDETQPTLAEDVDTLDGELEEPAAAESVSRVESVVVVNS